MPVTQEAFVSARIIKWARERLGASYDVVAEGISVNPQKVESWEEGSARPTFRQAQHLAQVLHIPFGYLFLSSPPETRVEIPDLRTVDGVLRETLSAEFSDVLNSAILKQNWYREYVQHQGVVEDLSFVGRYNIETPVDEVAADIAETLGVTPALRRQAATWEDFLRTLTRKSEDVGILIFRSGIVGNNTHRKLSVDEFRGFVLVDPLAPTIFINAQDAKSAQIFTLVHELTHIWIGQSGISKPDFDKRSSQQTNRIERFCNRVSAEVLIPKAEFLARWHGQEEILRNIHRLSAEFKVSTVTVLIQALNLERITYPEYERHLRQEMSKWGLRAETNTEAEESSSGGNFYNTLKARNGRRFTETLIEAALEGKVSKREAASLLTIKLQTITKIAEKIFE